MLQLSYNSNAFYSNFQSKILPNKKVLCVMRIRSPPPTPVGHAMRENKNKKSVLLIEFNASRVTKPYFNRQFSSQSKEEMIREFIAIKLPLTFQSSRCPIAAGILKTIFNLFDFYDAHEDLIFHLKFGFSALFILYSNFTSFFYISEFHLNPLSSRSSVTRWMIFWRICCLSFFFFSATHGFSVLVWYNIDM